MTNGANTIEEASPAKSEALNQTRMHRFDEMAIQVKDKIDNPAEAGGDRYVGLEHIDPESLKIRRWGKTTDVESSKIIFKAGDIIFGKRRAYQRKLAVAKFDGICSAHAMVLRPRTDVILEEFLPFFMQSDIFMDRAVKISVGGLSPTINWRDLAKEEFALPPLEEQRRISKVLGAAEEASEAFLEASVFADRVRGSLASRFVLGSSAVRKLEDVDANRLPPGWSIQPASDLCTDLITKGATPTKELSEGDTGIPFLKVYNLTFDGSLDFSVKPTFVTASGHSELRRSVVTPGDVLMNIVGPPLGKVSRVPSGFPEANINQAIVRYRLADGRMAVWLAEYLLSPLAQSWLHARSKKTSGQRNLTLAVCRDLPVPTPPPTDLEDVIGSLREVRERALGLQLRRAAIRSFTRTLISEQVGVPVV